MQGKKYKQGNKVLFHNTKQRITQNKKNAQYSKERYDKFIIDKFCKENQGKFSVNEKNDLETLINAFKIEYIKAFPDEFKLNTTFDFSKSNKFMKLFVLVLAALNFSKVNGQEFEFTRDGLLMIPPLDHRNQTIDSIKYSEERCEEMKKNPPNVLVYSENCADLNNPNRTFNNIGPETLSKLTKQANDYWCQNANCEISTKKNNGQNKRIGVCSASSLQGNKIGDTVRVSKNNPYGFSSNNPSGEYIDIRLAENKIKMTKDNKGNRNFDPEEGAGISKERSGNSFTPKLVTEHLN